MKKRYLIISLCAAISIVFSGCTFSPQTQESQVQSSAVESEESIQESSSDQLSAEVSEEVSEKSEVQEVSVPKKLVPGKEDIARIEDFDKKYFVNKLSDEMKYHFVKLYLAAESFEKSVSFDAPVTDDELMQLMYLLNYDCPELIHVGGDFSSQYNPDGTVASVFFTYVMKKEEYSDAVKKLDTIKKILKEKTEGKTEYETEKIVYDYIFSDCVYDESNKGAGSVYGTLVNKVSRCEGYCKSFSWCLRNLGFECFSIVGNPGWDSTAAVYPLHSWNIVKIDDEYYNVDITLDNVPKSKNTVTVPNYAFFNAPDNMIYSDRSLEKVFEDLGVPECKSTKYNYHIMNGLYFAKGEYSAEKFEGILDKYCTADAIAPISLKFEDSEDYAKASEKIQANVKNYLINKNYNLRYSTVVDGQSKTILIYSD